MTLQKNPVNVKNNNAINALFSMRYKIVLLDKIPIRVNTQSKECASELRYTPVVFKK